MKLSQLEFMYKQQNWQNNSYPYTNSMQAKKERKRFEQNEF